MVLLFGGTTEGKLLFEYLEKRGIPGLLSVATEYGRQVLPQGTEYVRVLVGRMDCEAMRRCMVENRVTLVLDATHPYADKVSENIRTVCGKLGISLVRVCRKAADREQGAVYVKDVDAAVLWLQNMSGNILLTTGSKTLEAFCGIDSYRERLYVRMLPVREGILKAQALKIDGDHLICQRGPFTVEQNLALIEKCNAAVLVTKESGLEGGFPEKAEAARKAGCTLLVVSRPMPENGLSVEELTEKGVLEEMLAKEAARKAV